MSPLALALSAGLRAQELVGLAVSDVDVGTGRILVRAGKGGKDRITYLDDGAAAAVAAWLRVRGPAPGSLLCPVSRGGVITLRGDDDAGPLRAVPPPGRPGGARSALTT